MIFKERDVIETNAKTNFWKKTIALGDIASSNVLNMCIQILPKWREIKKKNESLITLFNELSFFKTFHSISSSSFKIISFAVSGNFNFSVNLVMSFSRQKSVEIEKKKQKNKQNIPFFWSTKLCHPAKCELKPPCE